MQKLRPDMDIGRNIAALRRSKRMTQDEVVAQLQVRELKISKSTYAKLETNRMNIRVSELVALKDILGLRSFDDFFQGLSENGD